VRVIFDTDVGTDGTKCVLCAVVMRATHLPSAGVWVQWTTRWRC
jgi:hypothetical protein